MRSINCFDNDNIIRKATINGNVVVFYASSKNRNAYDDCLHLKHIGQGYYHSYNGTPAHDKELVHFWIKIK